MPLWTSSVDERVIETWRKTLAEAMEWVDPRDFRDFFACLEPIAVRDRTLVLEAPTQQTADFVRERYESKLSLALVRVSGGEQTALEFTTRVPVQAELFPLAADRSDRPPVPVQPVNP